MDYYELCLLISLNNKSCELKFNAHRQNYCKKTLEISRSEIKAV